MGPIKHWGEIPQADVEMIPDVTAEIQLAMSKSCLDQFVGEDTVNDEKIDHVV